MRGMCTCNQDVLAQIYQPFHHELGKIWRADQHGNMILGMMREEEKGSRELPKDPFNNI